MVIKSDDGRRLRSFVFKDESVGQEVRAVERRLLLESLANQLPPDTICFSSRLARISKTENGETLLELDNGKKLLAKIIIGCDGIRSPIAKWMGFSEPRYVGHCAFRGLAFYPNGQPFDQNLTYVYGRGLRAGFVPISSTKVYWFICYNSPSPAENAATVLHLFKYFEQFHFQDVGTKVTDPDLLKKQAEELIRTWPSELLDVVRSSADETVIKTPLVDRWLWPAVSPPVSAGGVVLVGDAWHPMTPNLGQGACCALEDAVVLAGKLCGALKSGPQRLEEAFEEYGRERWARVFPLTIRANLVGSLLQWDNPVGCAVRDNIVIPKLVRLAPMLEHTNYECELER
ncbi:hypothetical protein ACLOJK_033863 [Asimina triloba]